MTQRVLWYGKIFGSMTVDALLINVAMYFSLYLRLNTPHIPSQYLTPYVHIAIWFTLASLALFWMFRLYHRLWKYAGSRDAQVLIGAVFGSALLLPGFFAVEHVQNFPRSVYLLYALFGIGLVGGWRFLARAHQDWWHPTRPQDQSRILIVGAGTAGQLVAGELARHPEVGLAVGFIDDDELKRGGQIGPLRVLGTTRELREMVLRQRVDEVLFAIPSAPGRVLANLVEECRRLRVKTRTLPAINQMIGGQVRVSQIRDVQIEDLLQRESSHTDLAEIASYLTGKTVLVTGAGGTIGAELARQVAPFAPSRLLLLGMDETSIFEIDRELRLLMPDLHIVPVVADLRDRTRMEGVFRRYEPQVVFHAAAHKHVPLMERQPEEAVANNVTAVWQLLDLSHRHHVKSFVFISTDKAVNPISIYGCTKRIGELLVRVYSERSPTRMVTVRFGNVLGSRGSVIPIFQEQIQRGGPVTVTHPEMVRYFMTVREAAELVIQAGAMGNGGEIFVLDMGEPIRILDLATNLILLSGLRPGIDIDINFVGARPGEKLCEELLNDTTRTRATRHERIFVEAEGRLNASRVVRLVEDLIRHAESGDTSAVLELLPEIVPEYHSVPAVAGLATFGEVRTGIRRREGRSGINL